ncbi:MAG TPA: DUF2771 domain-containing protein [Mycobacterium sp.]
MKRGVVVLLAALVVLASAGAGVGAWLLVSRSGSQEGPQEPQISAYSNGRLTRVGPYLFCNAVNLNECQTAQTQGELAVNPRDPVQLSVDSAISRAPWRLLRVYENPADATITLFRPGTTLAVTIPTVDPHRGLLRGLAVQVPTLGIDPSGQIREVPHAEWSVRMLWG